MDATAIKEAINLLKGSSSNDGSIDKCSKEEENTKELSKDKTKEMVQEKEAKKQNKPIMDEMDDNADGDIDEETRKLEMKLKQLNEKSQKQQERMKLTLSSVKQETEDTGKAYEEYKEAMNDLHDKEQELEQWKGVDNLLSEMVENAKKAAKAKDNDKTDPKCDSGNGSTVCVSKASVFEMLADLED